MGPRTILAGGTSQRCDQNLQGHGAGLCGCFTAHLQALLPELPQVNAERLARYYWKEESSANAVAKIDYEIDRRTDREINRVWYGEEYCKSFDEGYINGAVKALAEVIKIYGISLNDSCLQDEEDSLNLSLGELRERLDAKLKEMEHPEEK